MSVSSNPLRCRIRSGAKHCARISTLEAPAGNGFDFTDKNLPPGLRLHRYFDGTSSFAQQSIQFTDVTKQAGISFTHFKGNKGTSINLEEFGPGICVSDYDGDGWQDIYFVNARDLYDRGIKVQNALYRNNGDGTFTDVA